MGCLLAQRLGCAAAVRSDSAPGAAASPHSLQLVQLAKYVINSVSWNAKHAVPLRLHPGGTLPDGWRAFRRVRAGGKSAGVADTIYKGPDGQTAP